MPLVETVLPLQGATVWVANSKTLDSHLSCGCESGCQIHVSIFSVTSSWHQGRIRTFW